jgi:hypothetical protein
MLGWGAPDWQAFLTVLSIGGSVIVVIITAVALSLRKRKSSRTPPKIRDEGLEMDIKDSGSSISSGSDDASIRSEERVIYQGILLDENIKKNQKILITPQRVTIGSATYSTANLTSVSIREKAPNPCLGIFFIMVGVAVVFLSLLFMGDFDSAIFLLPIGVVLAAVGIWIASAAKGMGYLALTTAAGQVPALWSSDREMIRQLVHHIETAIIERG